MICCKVTVFVSFFLVRFSQQRAGADSLRSSFHIVEALIGELESYRTQNPPSFLCDSRLNHTPKAN